MSLRLTNKRPDSMVSSLILATCLALATPVQASKNSDDPIPGGGSGGNKGLPGANGPLTPVEKGILDNGNGRWVVGNGRWVVGNGGDPLRLKVAAARELASRMVSSIRARTLDGLGDETMRQWIMEHRDALAADILGTAHIWVREHSAGEEVCALTDFTPKADIVFSYSQCYKTLHSYEDATRLLIHESLHHFGRTHADGYPDDVANVIHEAWEKGRMNWVGISGKNGPSRRELHSAIWDGDRMIIFGGRSGNTTHDDMWAYDPTGDKWEELDSAEAPSSRYYHQALWTGSKMIIWGGYENNNGSKNWLHNGGIWDAATGKWTLIGAPYSGAASNRFDWINSQTLTRAGDQLIIWGGTKSNGAPLGAVYDLNNGSWSTAITSGNAPRRLGGHSAVWTGDRLIVWGGLTGDRVSSRDSTNQGASWNPANRRWTSLTTSGAPAARWGQKAVWTGDQMLIFSGYVGASAGPRGLHSSGGIYDPATGKWEDLKSQIAVERYGHTANWNGREMLIMGGKARTTGAYFSQVIRYNPASGSWQASNSVGTPDIRWNHSAVMANGALIIWGGSWGSGGSKDHNTGGIFYP